MKKHIFISGNVQGVGFRHFIKTNANELGVKGWVKNLNDGRVEAIFQGDEKQVNNLIQKCKDGPRSAQVKNIDVSTEQKEDSLTSFEVRY